jgi:hypothetical protein
MLVNCPASNSSTHTFYSKEGQPTGTTYKWEIVSGADKAHIVGNDHNDYVWLQPDAGGAGTLRCRYTKWDSTQNQDVSCDSTRSFWVQAPSQANSTRQINAFSSGYQGGYYWMARTVTYTVRDQQSYPICGAYCDESFSNPSGPSCGSIQGGGADTDQNGVVTDLLYWRQLTPWDGSSLICQRTQSITVAGCPSAGSFWSNLHRFDQTPMITVTPQ